MNNRNVKRRLCGRSRLLLAAAAAVVIPMRRANAQTSQWIGGSADWNTPGHWSPSGVPGAADTVNVTSTLGLTQTITYDYTGADVILGTLTLNLTGGSAGTSEMLSMSANNLSADIEFLGTSGRGTFNQSGGSNQIDNSDGLDVSLYMGLNAGATGTYILSGTGTLTDNGNSFGNFGGVEYVGWNGTGIFNQTGGTNDMTANCSLVVSSFAGSTGNYQFSGGYLTAGSGEYISLRGSGLFNQSGGTNNAGGLALGYYAGSTGTYILSGTGSLSGAETIGVSGMGVFNQSGGTNTTSGVDVGSNAGSTGTFTLSGGSLTASAYSDVGDGGVGNFNQSGGTFNLNSFAGVIIANSVNSTGTYALSGTGSLAATGNEYVGYSGKGTFNQSGGTNAVGVSLLVGFNSGSMGTYLLSGGSLAVTGGGVFVGGSALAAGGTGVLIVSNSGSLWVTGTLKAWNTGRINLDVPATNVGNLAITGNGIVNLNGALNVNYGSTGNDPIASVVSYLKSGYNGGAWTGTSGIISTSAQIQGGPALSVGYADGNTDSGTVAGPNQIVVKYTLVGDANLDGTVGFADLVTVVQNFNKGGTDWAQGNFMYGASTNFNDLVAVVQSFNKSTPPPGGAGVDLGGTTIPLINSTDVQLPEPGFPAISALIASACLARRRRRLA